MKLTFNFSCVLLFSNFKGPIAFNIATKQLERFASRKIAEAYMRVNSDWKMIETKRL